MVLQTMIVIAMNHCLSSKKTFYINYLISIFLLKGLLMRQQMSRLGTLLKKKLMINQIIIMKKLCKSLKISMVLGLIKQENCVKMLGQKSKDNNLFTSKFYLHFYLYKVRGWWIYSIYLSSLIGAIYPSPALIYIRDILSWKGRAKPELEKIIYPAFIF